MTKFLFITAPLFINLLTYAKPNASAFATVFIDHDNGVSWSAGLPNRLTNGCWVPLDRDDINICGFQVIGVGEHQIIQEQSAAAKACSDVGARLPTQAEVISLIKKFNHTIENFGPSLSQSGFDQMNAVFNDMPNWFWTSSVHKTDENYAFAFQTSKNYFFPGTIGVVNRRNDIFVRCVQ